MIKNTIETDRLIYIIETSEEKNEVYIYDKEKKRSMTLPMSYREIKDFENEMTAGVLVMHGLLGEKGEWKEEPKTEFTGEEILEAPDGVYKVIYKEFPDRYISIINKIVCYFGHDDDSDLKDVWEEMEKIILIEKD